MVTHYEHFRDHAATSSNERGDYIASSRILEMPDGVTEVVVRVIPEKNYDTGGKNYRVSVNALGVGKGGNPRTHASVEGFAGTKYGGEVQEVTVNHSSRGSCSLEETLFYADLIKLAASTVEFYFNTYVSR